LEFPAGVALCHPAGGESAMRCPYCAEEIKDEAAACKHCHRDLFVARRLLDRIDEMNKRLALAESAGSHGSEPATGTVQTSRAAKQRYIELTALEAFTLTYIFLVLAHFLIVVHFDLKLSFLRLVSIAVPFVFGLLCKDSERKTLTPRLVLGVLVAVAAIITMAGIVSTVDKVPFWPKDGYEWREHGYYSASIAFGFFTGAVVRQTIIAFYAPNSSHNKTIDWVTRFIIVQFADGKPKFTLKVIRSVVSSVLGLSSAIISIVMGFLEFLK
jgi:hypothetical protein